MNQFLRLDWWLSFSFLLGLSGIALLIFLAVKYDRPKPKLHEGIGIFLTTSGISPGVKICWYAFSNQFFSTNDLDRYYIFSGGIAVIWLAVDNIVDLIKSIPNRNVNTNTNSAATSSQAGSNTNSNNS